MNGALFLCVWALLVIFIVIATILSIKLNLRLRDHYPQIYEDIGRPSLFSRSPDFLWRLVPHRKALSEADWQLRTILVRLYWVIMAVVVTTAIAAGWSAWHPG